MDSFPFCQLTFGISPSMSAESEPCKTDMIAGCDPTRLRNICHLHQFKDWTQATYIRNRPILFSEEETAAKVLHSKKSWKLSIDLDSPPRSSVMCSHCSSVSTCRMSELPVPYAYLHVYMHARTYTLHFKLHSLLSLTSFTRKVDKINRKPNEDLNKKAKCFLLLNSGSWRYESSCGTLDVS